MLISIPNAATAQYDTDSVPDSLELELAQEFAPLLYLHPDEVFYPISPVYALENSDLMNVYSGFVSSSPTIGTLSGLRDPSAGYYLDNRIGTIDDDNITRHFTASDYAPAIHSRVTEDTYNGMAVYVIQYYFYYPFNNGPMNTHEGDWEMIMVVTDSLTNPVFAAYSQHLGGEYTNWENVAVDGSHPKVYVALGSHANYFRPVEGSLGLASDQCSASGDVYSPDDYELVILGEAGNHPSDQGWLDFAGNWGDYGSASSGILGERGPAGPVYQTERWYNPVSWAQSINYVDQGWFSLNWTVANLFWSILGIMALVLIIEIFVIINRKKKQGTLGPRLTPFLYVRGTDRRSIGIIIAALAMVIAMAGYFMPWYNVWITVDAGEYSTPGAVQLLRMDGVHGLQFNRLEPGSGLVQVMGFPVSFGWLMLIGAAIFVIGTIGIQPSRKFGRKLIGRAIGTLVPAIVMILLISMIGSILAGYVQDAPPEVTQIVDTVSASPITGSTTQAIGDYGTATLSWGLGPGVLMFIVSAVMFLIAAILQFMANDNYFETQMASVPPPPGYDPRGQYYQSPYSPPPEQQYAQQYPPPPAYQPPPPPGPVTLQCQSCGNLASALPGTPPFQCMRCGNWLYPPQ